MSKNKLLKILDKKQLIVKIQKQMNEEYQAHYNYLAMAAYFFDLDFDGFGHYYTEQADDERAHALKYYQLMLDLDILPLFNSLDAPKSQWKTPLDALKEALFFEESITQSTHQLLELAEESKHYPLTEFLQDFVKEQVQEITTAQALVNRAQQLPDGQSIFFIDQELRQQFKT